MVKSETKVWPNGKQVLKRLPFISSAIEAQQAA